MTQRKTKWQLICASGHSLPRCSPVLPGSGSSGGWAHSERRGCWGRGPQGGCFYGSSRTRGLPAAGQLGLAGQDRRSDQAALIIAPTGAQRQALLTEPLRFRSTRDQLIRYFLDSEFAHAPNPVDAHVEPKRQDGFARLGRSYTHAFCRRMC
jgi:hypothetical protein